MKGQTLWTKVQAKRTTSSVYSSCNYLPVTTDLTKYECKVCGISGINFHEKPSTAMQGTGKKFFSFYVELT